MLTKEDHTAIKSSERRHNELLKSVSAKMPDPSVALVINEDGSQSAYVKHRGRFIESDQVTVIDMRV